MKRYIKYLFLSAAATLLFYSCKKAYTPDIVGQDLNYLVIEGIFNTGADSTFITLSRTVRLDKGQGINPEKNAQVTIEGDNGTNYTLEEKPNGVYTAPALNADVTKKYRLRIKTQSGNEYLSDYVEAKLTQPIDSIGYTINSDNLEVNVNTHDATNNSRYYRWTFEETWEFNASFESRYKSNGDTVLERDMVNDDIYHCWANERSRGIVVGSSAKLSQDVIKNSVLTILPGSSEKIGVKYSILVKQYALTKDAFEFWQNLKKNTEQLGSIFDPQPSQTRGNIHSVANPGEVVIGYFSASNVTQKRSFIAKSRLSRFQTTPFYPDCKQDSFLLARKIQDKIINEENDVFNKNKFALSPLTPTSAITAGAGIIGHMGTLPKCADCTLRGSKKRPIFWE